MSTTLLNDEELAYFVREVELQCSFAILAHEQLNNRFAEKRDFNADDLRIFNLYAFAVVTHIGNISKLFDSPRCCSEDPRYRRKRDIAIARCKQLKETLDVSDSMLFLGRKTRNYLEHYDERLEDWLHKPERKPMFDMGIEIRSRRTRTESGWHSTSLPPSQDKDYHRYYDPSSHRLYVNQRSFQLDKVVFQIKPLRCRAERWLKEHGSGTKSDELRLLPAAK